MKNLKTLIASILLIFAFVLTAESQNDSNENSDVIEFHQTLDFDYEINCNPDPKIRFDGTIHIIYIRTPNGLYTRHYDLNMEGVDENGGIWNWNEAWIFNFKSGQLNHDTRNVIIVGEKGAKLRLTIRFVRNGQGEIVRAEFEGGCP